MKAVQCLIAAIAAAAVIALPAVVDAQERMKHSGTIVAIDHEARTIVVQEVAPWKARDGRTVVVNRTITLTPETEFAITGRDHATLDAWPGMFVEHEIGEDALYLNDFVTVDCLHAGRRLLALKITVTVVP